MIREFGEVRLSSDSCPESFPAKLNIQERREECKCMARFFTQDGAIILWNRCSKQKNVTISTSTGWAKLASPSNVATFGCRGYGV
jgi:hypothetical protein